MMHYSTRTSPTEAKVHIYDKLPTEHAVHAAIELCKSSVLTNDKQVKLLVERCADPITAATEVIRFLIGRKTPENRLINAKAHDIVLAAVIASEFSPTDRTLSQELVTNVAKFGLYGRIESMTKRLLGRDINADEVIALTKSYCDDTASQGDSTERTLREFAAKYGTSTTVAEVDRMLAAFKKHWDDIPSL